MGDGAVKPDLSFLDGLVVDDAGTEELERQEAERQERARHVRLETHYRSPGSGVPRRYWDEGFSTFRERDGMDAGKVRDFARSPGCRILVLCGGNGTGKTHLGCAVIREAGGAYRTMLRLVYEVESAMSFSSRRTKTELLDGLCAEPMLVLDEVGRGVRQEQQQELLYYIVNERYSNMLPTVLISNLGKAELVRFLGEAVRDRLNETCEFLELRGSSWRGEKRTRRIQEDVF